ncbi:hypothetical protein [Enterobacter soli]|uniref:hypothetical protein n=1 Tax=Enterobacter soli TaxID=885040 RepID=UPI002F4029D5
MYIVKSCFKKDHICTRKTLRIGSLNEYRDTYEAQIADKEEGTVLFNFDLKDLLVPRDLMNFLSTYHGSYGTDTIDILELTNGTKDNPMHVTVHKYIATKSLYYKNRFIYCLSLLKNPRDANRIFSKYDSKWYISIDHIDSIIKLMSAEILKGVRERLNNGDTVFNEEIEPEALSITSQVQSIIYTKRIININNIKMINDAKQIVFLMRNAHFVKTNKFKNEKEIRFSFDFYHKGKMVEPVIKSIIINAEEILPLVKK